MTLSLLLIIIALVLGFYVSWNIGANDVANAIGTSVGSGALTLLKAVIIAGILEFCGAFFLGGNVSETVESGIVNPEVFSRHPIDYVYGMLAALLAAGIWLQIASFFGWPVSTTHAIVGGVLGFGVLLGGFNAIYWSKIGSIALSWLISPILGGGLAYFIFSLLRRKIFYAPRPIAAAKRITPFFVFALFTIMPLIILFNGLSNLKFHLGVFSALGIALLLGLITAWVSYFLIKKVKEETVSSSEEGQNFQVSTDLKKSLKNLDRVGADSKRGSLHDKASSFGETTQFRSVERIFVFLQIITACFMAFAHGSNDVANAIGPLSAIFGVIQNKAIELPNTVSPWLLVLGGVGIVLGLATWGWRVIETVGKKITELTPTRGFAAEFGAAITIVLASKLGLPISTTHTLVGAVLGVGFARGIGAINLNTIWDIVLAWVITIPAAAVLSVLFFYGFRALF